MISRFTQIANRIRSELNELEGILLKVGKLVDDAPEIFNTVKKELSAFADFLEQAD